MNFFEAQDNARKATRRLVIVYLIATLLIVVGACFIVTFALIGVSSTTAGPSIQDAGGLIVATGVVTLTVIVVATFIRTSMLSRGGAQIAASLGGTVVSPDTRDPLRLRLRNVVEEMAIASGVPVPDIFVLEEEQGINAFAAGFAPGDAAVAVTRGALETLDRDELQGVIAHEFSHILNGDMRLNIRMMGVLYGIMVIGMFGRTLLRGGRYGSFSSRRGKGASAILLIGLGLTILGWIGVFFARIVKAATSRQRENLADAAAVQFTRQTRGIAGALKKIGGYGPASLITARDPEEVNHMLFGDGMKLSSLFATHPPLDQRIQALEPGFDPGDYIRVDERVRTTVKEDAEAQAMGFSAGTVAPEALVESIGNPGPEHIALAQTLRSDVPDELYDAAHSPEDAYLLSIALLLDTSSGDCEREFALVAEQLGREREIRTRELAELLSAQGRALRLPLLKIAFPALKRRPEPQLEFLVKLLRRLVLADNRTTLFEFCFLTVIESSLLQSTSPATPQRLVSTSRRAVRDAILDLLRTVALAGSDSQDEAESAFAKAMSKLPAWAETATLSMTALPDADRLEQIFDLLQRLSYSGRRQLVLSMVAAVTADNEVLPAELELLHAICASLQCPMPAMVAPAATKDAH